MNEKEAADYIIEIKINENIWNWVGETIDLLPQCKMAAGKIVQVQKKLIRFLTDQDLRLTFQIARMFRRIVTQESGCRIYLKAVKNDGEEIR